MTYTSKEGLQETPLCIHRAPLGTHERFIGFLTEHFAGNFPTWLAPSQVAIVPVREEHEELAKKITKQLHNSFVRTEYMDASQSLGKRVRKAKDIRTPYTIIIGDKDIEAGMVTIEKRGQEQGSQMKFEDFAEMVSKEIKDRSL